MSLSPRQPPRLGLRLVVALPAEASPLISQLALSPIPGEHPFKIYRDTAQLHWLIVSGIGRHASSIATAYLAGLSRAQKSVAWLNVGIAGHATLPVGEIRAAHKITDATLGTSYYPPVLFDKLSTESLMTMPEPESAIGSNMLVDMEAAGFYASAATFASPELIHAIKVVSDHGMQAGQRLSKATVTEWINQQRPALQQAMEKLLDLSNQFAQRWADPDYYDAILAEYHFTATQKNQLRRLLQRWQVLLKDDDVVDFVWKHAATGREVLASLAERLDRESLTLPEA